jgi:hypothetical protein
MLNYLLSCTNTLKHLYLIALYLISLYLIVDIHDYDKLICVIHLVASSCLWELAPSCLWELAPSCLWELAPSTCKSPWITHALGFEDEVEPMLLPSL